MEVTGQLYVPIAFSHKKNSQYSLNGRRGEPVWTWERGGGTCLCLDSSPRSSSPQNSRYTEHLIQDRMESYTNHVEVWKMLYFYTYKLF